MPREIAVSDELGEQLIVGCEEGCVRVTLPRELRGRAVVQHLLLRREAAKGATPLAALALRLAASPAAPRRGVDEVALALIAGYVALAGGNPSGAGEHKAELKSLRTRSRSMSM